MSAIIHTWACVLLWITYASPDKTPDVMVTCAVSVECLLPCSFPPGSDETIEWFRQETIVFKFRRDEHEEESKESDENGDKDKDSDETEQVESHASVFTHLVSRGNATLMIRKTGLTDRGTYRCHVKTSNGEHNAKVIVKVEAPIRGLSLELSRLSGYEEMKCTVRNVFPAPRVTWATEPPTLEDLRPITRVTADKLKLYKVDSRLKLLKGRPDLIYICKVTTSYGGPAWTASLREREVRGFEGRDLTIPCHAPAYLNRPFLNWSFSNGEDDQTHILTYDSRSGDSRSNAPWDSHVELDGFRVPFGDGSLRLMDPKHSEHEGSYTCVFSMPYNTHTEHTDVTITAGERSSSGSPSYWWIVGLVIALLVLVLVGMFAYLKLKGSTTRKQRTDPEEVTELHLVKDSTVDSHQSESSPLTSAGGNNGQSNPQTSLQTT